ncbi:host attachment protein [Paraliomyxa miuraensis]|uniref:host attachment protein n=1 Tax=Paraliomyxa miuraensis TaxID=376150 RepID=UPI0022501EA6|nr:host attachment protein [Paraliomyxa miuraensis]MCX4246154.1 host attachment protein [Paraliomyxa miuraensis]
METDFLPPNEAATGRWVVVANGARARVFETYRHAPGLRPVLPYELTVNRLRDHERWADRAGTSHERVGHKVHSMAASTDPSEHQHDLLAREVAEVLQRGRIANRVDAIVLVAAPEFLGRLRRAIDAQTRALVVVEDGRDLSRLPEHELEARIPQDAWLGGTPPPRRRS